MIDYLELAAREDADVLREAERLARARILAGRAEIQGRETGTSAPAGETETAAAAGGTVTAAAAGGTVTAAAAGETETAAAAGETETAAAAGETETAAAAGETVWEQIRRTREAAAQAELSREMLREGEDGPEGLLPLLDLLTQAERAAPAGWTVSWAEAGLRPAQAEQIAPAGQTASGAEAELPLAQAERAASAWQTASWAEAGFRPARNGAETGERLQAAQTALTGPKTARWGGGADRAADPWMPEDLTREVDRTFQRDARRYDGGFFLY